MTGCLVHIAEKWMNFRAYISMGFFVVWGFDDLGVFFLWNSEINNLFFDFCLGFSTPLKIKIQSQVSRMCCFKTALSTFPVIPEYKHYHTDHSFNSGILILCPFLCYVSTNMQEFLTASLQFTSQFLFLKFSCASTAHIYWFSLSIWHAGSSSANRPQSHNNGSIEQPRLEGTLKGHLIKPFVGKESWMRLSSVVFSQKWDHLPGVWYTNIRTEQRYCLYCIFVQIWVLGNNCTRPEHCLAESQGIYTLTKTNKLLNPFWLVHHVTCWS